MTKKILCVTAIVISVLMAKPHQSFAQFITTVSRIAGFSSKPVTYEQSDSTRIKDIDEFSTEYRGIVVDSATNEPIQSAVVYLMGVADMTKDVITKSTVTDKKGRFSILVAGPSKLEITCLGYKVYTQHVRPKSNFGRAMSFNSAGQVVYDSKNEFEELGKIKLSPDLYSADEVVVRARLQMFEQKGDTTRIFPRLTKTLEGDALIEVLKQIPGFKVEGNSIYDNGKLIERTYVNNTLLFGQDAITAFLKLSAESALAIDTYDEKISETEKNLTNRKTDTRRVANITTSKKVNNYFTADVLAELGIDHDKDIDNKRNIRYGLDANFGLFKVGRQIEAGVNHNNLTTTRFSDNNLPSMEYIKSGNPKTTEATFRYESQMQDTIYDEATKTKIPRHKGFLMSNYKFSDDRNSNESKSTSNYFPTDYFESQIRNSHNSYYTNTQRHRAFMSYMNLSGKKLPINFNLNASYEKSDRLNTSQETTNSNGINISKTDNSDSYEENRMSINFNTHIHKPIWDEFDESKSKQFSLNIGTNIEYSKNNGDGFRNFELTDQQGTNLTNLDIESNSPNINTNTSIGLSYYKSYGEKSSSIALNMGYIYQKDKQHRISLNQATGQIDESYSNDYVRNNNVLSANIEASQNFDRYKSLRFMIEFENHTVKNDEEIPNDIFLKKDFNIVTYSLGFMTKHISFDIYSSGNIPYLSQLSNILDNTNPMSLSAGNPDLKNSHTHSASLSLTNRSYEKTNKVVINLSTSLSLTTDPITQIRHYFNESTVLEKYEGYIAPAGATLYIPENVGNYFNVNADFSISHMIQRINTSIALGFQGSYSNPYASINEDLIRNKNGNATTYLSIISTPTRKLRINISERLTYSWQKNNHFKDRSRQNNFSVNARYDFLHRYTLNTTFKSHVHKAYTTGQTIDQNSLNISLGARLLKKRNGLLSFNVSNLFNDKSGYNLDINDQAITEQWTQNFARFYSISFQYKFNSIDHTK